jgi:hypothetical protein
VEALGVVDDGFAKGSTRGAISLVGCITKAGIMLYRWARIFVLLLAFYQSSPMDMRAWAALLKVESAIRSIVAIVDVGARATFLAELRKFAETEGFSLRAGQVDQFGTHFIVEISRKDIHITIINPFPDPREVRFIFYQTGTQPVPDAVVDALAGHLRGELGSIQGVVFKEANDRN